MKIAQIRSELPAIRHIISFDPALAGEGVLSFDGVVALGEGLADREAEWKARALAARPDDVATLIYTSGTTGDPKGVMLTHGNFVSNALSGLSILRVLPEDEYLSFLPLSHVFERMLHFTIFYAGAVISYARSVETVAEDMADRKPTILASVPRLYEKIYARVVEGASASPVKHAIFVWASRSASAWADLVLAHRPVPFGIALKKRIANKLVFSKLQARTGGRIRFFISGGAPLAAELAKFFYAAGLPVLEGYGLTETSPVITVNDLESIRIGTVGKAMPGIEVRIAPDGEILTRGPHVMKGYYNRPEATAESIDADGWFRTGDIGELDADGHLKITDRKKDLIVTAGGKNIAPQPIEGRIRRNPFVLNAVMLGDKRKFPILLVVPNVEKLRVWARYKQLPFAEHDAQLLASTQVADKMDREVAKMVEDLAHFEQPKKVLIVPDDFTIERGELTPKMSVRRRVVEDHYKAQIDALYDDGHPPTTG